MSTTDVTYGKSRAEGHGPNYYIWRQRGQLRGREYLVGMIDGPDMWVAAAAGGTVFGPEATERRLAALRSDLVEAGDMGTSDGLGA